MAVSNSAGDVLMITFDALRYDVACAGLQQGRTPFLGQLLGSGWERRHTPGSFTYAAHAAFFAGFWPTPAEPGPQPRPFALRFPDPRAVPTPWFWIAWLALGAL